MIELTLAATRKLDRLLRAEGFSLSKTKNIVWAVKMWLKGTVMTELKANEHQPGGSHYRKHSPDFQHWDWVVSCNIHYLLAASSKYLTRWRDKGKPLEDLRKAAHYLDKCIEDAAIIMAHRSNASPFTLDWTITETNRFVAANRIPTKEASICMLYATWRCRSQLVEARKEVGELIEDYHNNEAGHLKVDPNNPPAPAKKGKLAGESFGITD